ncbi:MAG: hypothetical protein M5U16_00710 [Hyphomicrobium sp.]|nr:hypothetical protein [Hyphomicrobium sp.]
MNQIDRRFEQRRPGSGQASVLDSPEHIKGLPHDKKSAVEEARGHPEQAKACKSVLDGPACIAGLPH